MDREKLNNFAAFTSCMTKYALEQRLDQVDGRGLVTWHIVQIAGTNSDHNQPLGADFRRCD